MIDNYYIKDFIPPIEDDAIVQNILNQMEDFQLQHLPVIVDGTYRGLISEEQLLDCNLESPLGRCGVELNYLFIMLNQHFLEAAGLISTYHVSAVPIINDKNEYLGMVTKESVYNYMTDNLMTKERGSIIILSIPKRSYSLNEISRVCEAEQAKILGILVKDLNELLELTIKLNNSDIFPISSTLEKMGYTILDTYVEGKFISSYKDHYDYLLNYLSI